MESPVEPVLTPEAYRFVVDLVYQHSRIRLGDDKQALLANRLRHRLKDLSLSSYQKYCQLLDSVAGPEEIEHLVDLISTNHTKFFREPEHFSFLIKKALPTLLPRLLQDGTPLKVWSAACSSGEEPYTLAIVLAEALRAYPSISWNIFASDISKRMLARAQHGIYRMESVEPVEPDLLKRYFQQGVGTRTGDCRIKSELKEHLLFHRINLFQAEFPIPTRQHVIFCRNVMIYFDSPSRATLIARLTEQFASGGYLIVGHSE
ncbi:MAG: protein-glutamate O-methyltransferase CheR, partial [Verrucomicrobia bacterium]|nr:protein-glutamate O-methyltransferase CheR [Verrucomicrobiota bacterium]